MMFIKVLRQIEVILPLYWLILVSSPHQLWCQETLTGNEISKKVGTTSQEEISVHTDKPYYLAGETLWFSVYCTEKGSAKPSELSSVVYLEILDQSNQVVSQIGVKLDSGIANGQLMLGTDLATGYYWLRAYTAWMRNGQAQDFYQQALWIINPLTELSENLVQSASSSTTKDRLENQTNLLEVSTDQESYHLREAVKLAIEPQLSDSEVAYFSVSVYPFYPQLEVIIDADKNRISQQPASLTDQMFLPETAGPIIYGRIAEPIDKLMVSIGGKEPRLGEVLWTDSTEFLFQLSTEVDYQQLFFWSPESALPQVTLNPVFDPRPAQISEIIPKFDSSTIAFIEKQSINVQVSNLYAAFNFTHGKTSELENSVAPFYGVPEYQYLLDDYTRFPSLEEAFREYVRYVSLKRNGSQLQMHVWDHYANNQSIANNIFFDDPALVLLDGIPVKNIDWLLNQDPLLIQSVEIVTKRYLVGNQWFSGLVNLSSYDQNLLPDELLTAHQVVPYQDLQNPMEFHHPQYTDESTDSRIPDRRNTLFWQPRMTTSQGHSADLIFFTGDVTGIYKIVIHGISSNGQLIHQYHYITVEGGYQ